MAFLDRFQVLYQQLLSIPHFPGSKYPILLVAALAVLTLLSRFIYKDYHAFLALGPGGTPSTFRGYLWINWLKCHALSHKDCLVPPPLEPDTHPTSGYLLSLPHRSGPRPVLEGIAPQRQKTLMPPRHIHRATERALRNWAAAYPTLLRIGVSACEKWGFALFLNDSVAKQRTGYTHLNETCHDTREICHLHDTVSALFFMS